jgi:hypothetical protein
MELKTNLDWKGTLSSNLIFYNFIVIERPAKDWIKEINSVTLAVKLSFEKRA